MRVTFSSICEENQNLYFWLFKMGKINFDISSTVELLLMASKHESNNTLSLYLSQQMLIHFNEAIKLLKDFDKKNGLENYISDDFRSNDAYARIISEMDFKNLKTFNNKFVKSFRDESVHYKQSKNQLKSFLEVIDNMSEQGFFDIDKHFPEEYNLEIKAQIIHFNMNVINKGVEIQEFADALVELLNSLSFFCDDVTSNILHKIACELESDKIV